MKIPEIALVLHVTKQRVEQIIRRALAKVRGGHRRIDRRAGVALGLAS